MSDDRTPTPENGRVPIVERPLRRLTREIPSAQYILGDLREEYDGIRRQRHALVAELWYLIHAPSVFLSLRRERRKRRRDRVRVGRGERRVTRRGPRFTVRNRIHSLRHAIRQLVRAPVFSAIAILTLALATGGITVTAAIVRGVLLDPLPFEDPQEIALLETNLSGLGWIYSSIPEFNDFQERLTTLESIAAYGRANVYIGDSLNARRELALVASHELFPMLGVAPVLGRTFTVEEDLPGAARVAVLSHTFWSTEFGEDPGIVGRTIDMSGSAFEVVGVMPEGFFFPTEEVIAWIPYRLDRSRVDSRNNHFMSVAVRLADDVPIERAADELRAVTSAVESEHPDIYAAGTYRTRLREFRSAFVGDVELPLTVLFIASALILVIASVNVANLTLTRAEDRRQERSIRAALGASRGHLVTQVVGEVALLTALGGVLGIAVSHLGLESILSFAPAGMPRLENVVVDGRILLFVIGSVSGVAGLFSLLPTLETIRARNLDLTGIRGAAAGPRQGWRRTRAALLVAQIGFAGVVAVGAGLMGRSLHNLDAVDLGFRPEGVATFKVRLPARYSATADRVAVYGRIRDALAATPGVETAGIGWALPTEFYSQWTIVIEDDGGSTAADLPAVTIQQASPEYFESMGMRILAGRGFEPSDREGTTAVVIVNQSMAERFWPGQDPVGKRMRVFATNPVRPWLEVVGVVGDVRNRRVGAPPDPIWYVPLAQTGTSIFGTYSEVFVVARSVSDRSVDLSEARSVIQGVDPTISIGDFRPMTARVRDSEGPRHLALSILRIFTILAIVLALMGVFGVASVLIRQRRSEIGLRKALGAADSQVMIQVLSSIGRLAVVGALLGIGVGVSLARSIQALLYGVTPSDPITLIGIFVVLCAATALGTLGPAWRASRLDPVRVLRNE